jgi:hypothetical protein
MSVPSRRAYLRHNVRLASILAVTEIAPGRIAGIFVEIGTIVTRLIDEQCRPWPYQWDDCEG